VVLGELCRGIIEEVRKMISNCCNAPLFEECDVCKCCREHCEVEEYEDE